MRRPALYSRSRLPDPAADQAASEAAARVTRQAERARRVRAAAADPRWLWGAVGLLLLALGAVAIRLRERPAFRAAMRGLMPALVGLLAATAVRLGFALVPAGAAFPPWPACAIFATAFGLVLWKNPHPALLMLGAAAAGAAFALF